MQRLLNTVSFLVAMLTVGGCGSQVGLTPNANSGSVLRSGIYTGDMLCEGTFTDPTGTLSDPS